MTSITNNLGRLPNEILIKILRYVVSNPHSCPYREILRLGSVSKRFSELTKVAELYKGINPTYCKLHGSSEYNEVPNNSRPSFTFVVYGRKYLLKSAKLFFYEVATDFLFIKDLKQICSIGLFISCKRLATVGTLPWLIHENNLNIPYLFHFSQWPAADRADGQTDGKV